MSDWDATPGLTVFNGLDAMVASYERSRALIIEGFASIAAAREEFKQHFALGGSRTDRLSVNAHKHSHHSIDDSPDHALEELKHKGWSVIVDRLELKKVMSAGRWHELQKQLDEGELPEITHDSVSQFGLLHINPRSLESMMKEAIVEVYRWLRPGNYDRYKRNGRFEIPERMALTWVVERQYLGSGFHVRYGSGRPNDPSVMLLALENVFNWLDGKGQVAKSHKSEIEQAIEKCTVRENLGTTPLFEFRCYKNNSLHIRFLRMDLVKRLNEIAGGLNLRGDEDGAGGDMVPA